MKTSSERILTTHVGSLARPADLVALLRAKEHGEPFDRTAFDGRVTAAVADVVERQVAAGIDVVSDGEQGKPSFNAYVNERLTGFEARQGPAPTGGPWLGSRERAAYPEYYEWLARTQAAGITVPGQQVICTGPIRYRGQAAVQADIVNLRAATAGRPVEEIFLPAIAPSIVGSSRRNEFYRSDEEYYQALAEAMREEYRAIIDAGFVVQVDDPRLSSEYSLNPALSVEETRSWAARQVEVINAALAGLPRDRVRFHTCYSIDIGPRTTDLELKDIVDIMLRINAGAYSFEASNPRHEHEYHIWETVPLPDDAVLIPGVISHTTHLVEHPELIAERIGRFASIVGRERVIAGADCGFAATARPEQDIHPTVAWAKLAALGEGARLASKRLW